MQELLEKLTRKQKRIIRGLLWTLLWLLIATISGMSVATYIRNLPEEHLKTGWDYNPGTIVNDLSYENENGNGYNLYIPRELDDSKAQYLILYIHGGSFNSGSKAEGDSWCRFFAAHGYLAASMDYTLQKKGNVRGSVSYRYMNQEVENCVTAIKEYCKENLGIEVKKMATAGESAGGTLAMNYAYTHTEEGSSAIPVAFIVQMTGPSDFEPGDWQYLKWSDMVGSDAELMTMITGYNVSNEMIKSGEYEKYLNEVSPARLVSENSQPMLCAYGSYDHIVPIKLKYLLFHNYEKYGLKYDFVLFPNSNHGMYSDLDMQDLFFKKALEYCETYFN